MNEIFNSLNDRLVTPEDNLIEELYKPAIKEAVDYKRMAGYFSSSIIDILYDEIKYASKSNFKMKIICSPELSNEDKIKISQGYSYKEIIEKQIINSLEDIEKVNGKLPYITSLIADGIIDIKFVVMRNGEGIFHAKVGIFTDGEGNKLAFNGSSNETYSAVFNNFEIINLFTEKTIKEKEFINDMEYRFNQIWLDKQENLLQCNITENILDKVKKIRTVVKENKEEYGRIEVNQKYDLYDYQLKAINLWKYNNYRGLLEMATGTGKTLTAIACQEQLAKQLKSLVTFIVAPQIDLVNQWSEELEMLNIKSIRCSSIEENYIQTLKRKLKQPSPFEAPLFVITTSNTFQTTRFQKILSNYLKQDAILICDEVHSFGAEKMRGLYKAIDEKFKYRLGVSATPHRKTDSESEELINFFDKIVFKYDLKDAIDNGFLNEYKYIPIVMSFNDEELLKYRSSLSKVQLSKKLSAIQLKEIERLTSSIANSNSDKVERLKLLLDEEHINDSKIVYCSPGNYNDGHSIFDEKHIKYVSEELGAHGCRLRVIDSTVPADTRGEILDQFRSGYLDTLLAIKCLDQGVNLKEVTHAYILSSTDSLTEFIQRRGRILRTAPNKPISYIYDLVMLPEEIDNYLFNPELEDAFLVDRELRRMEEYNSAAENYDENLIIINEIKDAYQDVLEELYNE